MPRHLMWPDLALVDFCQSKLPKCGCFKQVNCTMIFLFVLCMLFYMYVMINTMSYGNMTIHVVLKCFGMRNILVEMDPFIFTGYHPLYHSRNRTLDFSIQFLDICKQFAQIGLWNQNEMCTHIHVGMIRITISAKLWKY